MCAACRYHTSVCAQENEVTCYGCNGRLESLASFSPVRRDVYLTRLCGRAPICCGEQPWGDSEVHLDVDTTVVNRKVVYVEEGREGSKWREWGEGRGVLR